MTTGVASQEYPIKPIHIDEVALEHGHIADFTVSPYLLAAIVKICTVRGSWQPIEIEAVEELMKREYPLTHDFVLREAWNQIYRSFYVVKDGCVQLTHECITQCFKKFPQKALNLEQNRHGVLS